MALERHFYRLPAEGEDDAVAELYERGTAGVQVLAAGAGEIRIEAYFSTPPDELDLPGAVYLGREPVPAEDWLATWRDFAQPFAVGETLWFDPREPELTGPVAAPAGRTLFRIPARAAFGTGSHESTRLALELLEQTGAAGRRVIDVGTGTGILALVALARGARSADAFDLDVASPFHARVNATLNGIAPAPRFFSGTLEALEAPGHYELALVNIIPEVFLPELPRLAPLLAPGAEAIFSGILAEKAGEVAAGLQAQGFEPVADRREGEWIAFRTAFRPSS